MLPLFLVTKIPMVEKLMTMRRRQKAWPKTMHMIVTFLPTQDSSNTNGGAVYCNVVSLKRRVSYCYARCINLFSTPTYELEVGAVSNDDMVRGCKRSSCCHFSGNFCSCKPNLKIGYRLRLVPERLTSAADPLYVQIQLQR